VFFVQYIRKKKKKYVKLFLDFPCSLEKKLMIFVQKKFFLNKNCENGPTKIALSVREANLF
jgi:hypothetical protein